MVKTLILLSFIISSAVEGRNNNNNNNVPEVTNADEPFLSKAEDVRDSPQEEREYAFELPYGIYVNKPINPFRKILSNFLSSNINVMRYLLERVGGDVSIRDDDFSRNGVERCDSLNGTYCPLNRKCYSLVYADTHYMDALHFCKNMHPRARLWEGPITLSLLNCIGADYGTYFVGPPVIAALAGEVCPTLFYSRGLVEETLFFCNGIMQGFICELPVK